MNKELIEMLKSVIKAAENGGTVEVIIHAEDDERECACEECTCEREESSSGSIEEQLEKDDAWDKLVQEVAIAKLCMRESKILTEKVNFVMEEDGEQGVGTVNDVLEFCARHQKVKLQAVIK